MFVRNLIQQIGFPVEEQERESKKKRTKKVAQGPQCTRMSAQIGENVTVEI